MPQTFQDAPLTNAQATAAQFTDAPLPGAGTWEDRGVGGQVWHPATAGGSDRTRQDTNIVGIDHAAIANRIADWASTLHPSLQKPAAFLATLPADAIASLVEMVSAPETVATAGAKPALAAMDAAGSAAMAGGRAVLRVAKSPAARNAAAAIVKHGSTAAGAYLGGTPGAIVGSTTGEALADLIRAPIVEPAPDPGHVSLPGYPRETSTPAPAPPTAATAAPTEFQAAQAARANTLPDQKALNEAALAARRAAYQASQQPAADEVVTASGKLHFTAPEWAAFRELRARGVSLEDAATGAKAAGELARTFGLSQPTLEQTQFPKGARR